MKYLKASKIPSLTSPTPPTLYTVTAGNIQKVIGSRTGANGPCLAVKIYLKGELLGI